MNVFLWVLQGVLAFHTAAGAIWKFSSSEQQVPSLSALPHTAWLTLAIIEIGCAVALLVRGSKPSIAWLAPLAALCIAAEMALFSALHLSSGISAPGEIVYWSVVAAVGLFIAYGRLVLKPA